MWRFAERRSPSPDVFWSRISHPLAGGLEVVQEDYDVPLSVHDEVTATLLWLRQQGRFHPRIICLLIGVADWSGSAEPDARKRALEYLVEADCMVALGLAEVEFLRTCV